MPSFEAPRHCSGSPCVGFSGANPNGRGIDDPESNKLWFIPVLAAQARKAKRDLFIIFRAENVEMGSRAPPLRKVFGVDACHLCASKWLPARRPRIYVTNLRISEAPTVEVDPASCLAPGWRPLWGLCPQAADVSSQRFGTFLRPFGPGKPQEFPASYHRLPLSTYSEHGLVYRPDAPPDVLTRIRSLVEQNMRISTADLKKIGGRAVKLRGVVADFIHKDGQARYLRPLSSTERDRALGFPAGASALEPATNESQLDWSCMEATGNSFAVPVLAHILKPIADFLLRGVPLPLHDGFPTTLSPSAALAALGASSSTPLSSRR